MYPHRPDLHFQQIFAWSCDPCDARVGCHPRTTNPLGTLAKAPLREARKKAHAAFDPLWRRGRMRFFAKRWQAYKWLSRRMDLHVDDTHISMFNEEQCEKVVALCSQLKADQFRKMTEK